MGEYHGLYLHTYVSILCDCAGTFRAISIKDYKLDPSYYFKLPNYSWGAMLLYTKVKLERIMYKDMYALIERGLRGGICQVVAHMLRNIISI